MNYLTAPSMRPEWENRAGYDVWLLALTLCLCICGAIFVMTSSAAHSWQAHHGNSLAIFWNHVSRLCWGLGCLVVLSLVDYHRFEKHSRALILLSILLLVAVYFVPQAPGATARRWINAFGLSFQPAEFAKYALIAYLAARFNYLRQDSFANPKQVYYGVLVIAGIILALVAPEKNLSMAALIFGSTTFMIFLSDIELKPLLLPGVIGIVLLGLLAWFTPYMHDRLVSFFTGILNPMQASYHVKQSLVGIGQGGISGMGLGGSTQKNFFLPEPHKDFIFSIIGEELGIFGAAGLLLTFLAFFSRAWRISKSAPDDFGYFLGMGITCALGLSLFVNVGVTLGLLPPTGQPLPFISYGGSSLMMSLGAVGILLNISKQALRRENSESALFTQ
jgi:cell division protein FtsW